MRRAAYTRLMTMRSGMAGSICELRVRYRRGEAEPVEVVTAALASANSNAGRNVFLARDEGKSLREAGGLRRDALERQPLWGVPVAVKDCFDVEGFVTTSGSKYLVERREVARRDSAVAERLRRAGAVIVGKAHLHQLAYGITGENPDYGDCVQPEDERLLTGGSSSGSAASVQEGSAWAAIGTDTGGSVRTPASLCGIAGYRGSLTLGQGLWRGGDHLAQTFDTIGWLYGELADGPLLGEALYGLKQVTAPKWSDLRVGVPEESYFYDCEREVMEGLGEWTAAIAARGARVERFNTAMWDEAMEIFVPLQANEAAALHPEPRDVFDRPIAERLRFGASFGVAQVEQLRRRLGRFRDESEGRLGMFDLLLMPCSPVAELRAREDHSGTRAKLLRYTVPVSMLGRPTVTLKRPRGGPQLIGRVGEDATLLALSAELGRV
jgi:Asp-tRNA(Asn)/Glu-tRNA(Gln) amidotransferase A subunit family amidase